MVEFSYFPAPIALKHNDFLSLGAKALHREFRPMSDRPIRQDAAYAPVAHDWPTRDWLSLEWLSIDTAAVIAVASFILLIVVGILPRSPF